MTDLSTKIKTLMQQNRREVDGHLFTVPAPNTYPYQWLWDSCFHSIILAHFDTAAAKAELSSLFIHQHPNGMLGHITYWDPPTEILKIKWATKRTSHLSQPPMPAYAALKVFEKSQDKEWLTSLFEPLCQYYKWLLKARRIDDTGLLGIVNPDESGEDNSPRFDAALGLSPQHDAGLNTEARYKLFAVHEACGLDATCTSETFFVYDAPFNAITIANLHALAEIANVCNDTKHKRLFTTQADSLKQSMHSYMLHDCFYHGLSSTDRTPITVKTSGLFIPLWAKLYSQFEAEHLITTTLLNPDWFWHEYGVSTVAKDEASYDPDEPTWGKDWQRPHWRGPIWIGHHWFIYHGLKNYGFHDAATELKTKSERLLQQNGFREYFHPDTGVGMGAHDFTWGALVLDMQ